MGFSLFSHPRLCLLVILLVTVSVVNGRKTYHITNYGARPDGKTDSSKALQIAWALACNDSRSTVVVPGGRGDFLLNPVRLSGPCAGPITFFVTGVLKAPEKTFLDSEEWILFMDVQGLTVTGNGVLDGQGAYAWSVNPCKLDPNCKPLPTNLKFSNVKYGRIEGITSLNSKFFHIVIDGGQHVDIENIIITAPADSKNTDGIHIGRSQYVQVHNVNIGTGDDCISFGPGTSNVMISQVNCGPGHGISIGSLGKYQNEQDVNGIIVKNCTITKTTNGLRIKTWAPSTPSKVYNITYQDIILNGVQNPILIDQHYCPNNQCQQQGESSVEISNVRYLNIVGSSQDELSANLNCSGKVPCKDIELRRLNIYNGHQRTKAACYYFNGKFHHCQSPNHCG